MKSVSPDHLLKKSDVVVDENVCNEQLVEESAYQNMTNEANEDVNGLSKLSRVCKGK